MYLYNFKQILTDSVESGRLSLPFEVKCFMYVCHIVKERHKSFYSVKIAVGALVCQDCVLKGDITIGPRTIIHPRASIIAEAGPIIIGEGNIIEEMATIANR